MRIFQISFSFLLFWIFFIKLYGQEDSSNILAIVTVDSWEKQKINGAHIFCTDMNTYEAKGTTTVSGIARIYLNLNTLYLLEVSYPGYYKKAIYVETNTGKKNIPSSLTISIEILLKKNCENDTLEGVIMNEAMGRITYNNFSGKFEYDTRYTYRMENIYEDLRKKRCELAGKIRQAQKIAIEMGDSAKNTEKVAQLEAELERLAVEINKLETSVKEYAEKDLNEKIESFNGIKNKQTTGSDTSRQNVSTSSDEWKKVKPKFDETKPYIFIFPRHGWPSELQRFLQDSNYISQPIGTFCYSLNDEKKDIYIEDASELRQKFPNEFNKAFYNWDYIVNMNNKKD